MAGIAARDRKTLIQLVQQAQLVDAFGRFPKKQFMDKPEDQARVAERVMAMRKTAADLSDGFRKAHPEVPWADLEEIGRSPEDLWKAAKKLTPRMLAALEPLLADEPAAAFILREPARATKRGRGR